MLHFLGKNHALALGLLLGVLLILLPKTQAAPTGMRANRASLEAQTKILMGDDPEIQSTKQALPELIFKHPSFVDHPQVQTIRYHEVYVEKLGSEHTREWEVFGAGVDTHYTPASGRFTLGKQLKRWSNSLSFTGLFPEEELAEKITTELELPETISSSDFTIHHKLQVEDEIATPIYWIEIKARALSAPAGRILVFNALDGQLLQNFSKHHHATAGIPPIIVRDGRPNSVFNKKAAGTINDDAFVQRYRSQCQVISENKKSLGEAILINPAQCGVVIQEGRPSPQSDQSAKRAQDNSEKILSYYLTTHDQYGADNDRSKKTAITSIVHIGKNYDNAYWDAELGIMAYGDGSGGSGSRATKDYTLALDIAGHEFTHAIISSTANFVTPGEPGALNEAFADIFGVLISRSTNRFDDWNIGKQLYDNADGDSNEVALRSLSNPAKYKTATNIDGNPGDLPFPEKYSQIIARGMACNDDNDQCQVHANSTIWSHNAYLVDSGLQKLNYSSVQADQIVGNIFFIALTHRLHENTTMKEAAHEVLAACQDLYKSPVCAVVESSFRETELLN